jgi:PKD repeat protein
LYPLAELDPSVPSCATVIAAPGFAASDTAVCQKFCVDFEDLSTNNPISWQWSFPGRKSSHLYRSKSITDLLQYPGNFDVTLITVTANGSDTLTLLVTSPFFLLLLFLQLHKQAIH